MPESFPLHVDDWPARNLLNVFTEPAPDSQGATLVLPPADYEEPAVGAFGAEQAAEMLRQIRREIPWDREIPWSLEQHELTFDDEQSYLRRAALGGPYP